MTWQIPTGLNEDGKEFQTDTDTISQPGRYHVRVVAAEEVSTKHGSKLLLTLEALSCAQGKTGELGKTHKEWISPNQRDQAYAFAVAAGLVSTAEAEAAKKAGQPLTFEPSGAVDRQLLVDLVEHKYQGFVSLQVGYKRFFSVASPEASGNLNRGMLDAAADAKYADPFRSTPASTEAAPAVEADEFEGLFDK